MPTWASRLASLLLLSICVQSSPPPLSDEVLSQQDGCQMGHVVRWKPVGDSWLKVCMHNSLPLTNREKELSVAQDARCRESIRLTLRSLAGFCEHVPVAPGGFVTQ